MPATVGFGPEAGIGGRFAAAGPPTGGYTGCGGRNPAAGFVPPAQTIYPPVVSYAAPLRPPINSGPNPTVAGILAGFFPIGVGAVYAGQYAKGLAHLVVMVLLIHAIA